MCIFLFGSVSPCMTSNPCQNSGQCHAKNNERGYSCNCRGDYYGDDCEKGIYYLFKCLLFNNIKLYLYYERVNSLV